MKLALLQYGKYIRTLKCIRTQISITLDHVCKDMSANVHKDLGLGLEATLNCSKVCIRCITLGLDDSRILKPGPSGLGLKPATFQS